jgi:4-hydroxy-3-polyprenylbenzoate decarboxylase
MAERTEQLGEKLPISISIGVDPAIELASCFEPPTTPLGFDELSIAGALRKEPVELCKCITINERAIANAEYVIEGEVIPGVRVREDKNTGSGYAMPEFPGYLGKAGKDCWQIRVKAVTHRKSLLCRPVLALAWNM